MPEMNDMAPRADRSIRNIPIPPTHRHVPPPPTEPPENSGGDFPPRQPRRRRPLNTWWWLGGIVIACAIVGLLLSTVFEGATITIYPKEQAITPAGTLTALPNAPGGQLAYQTMTITQSATTSATASGTQHVSKAASGVITIANAYNTSPQQLVATTRFAAPDGKIYRIHTGVTVPGATQNADGSLTPGTVTATVYADQPGPSYNRDAPTTFTIPGFKGTARYSKFSAQSQGPITGGFIGDQPAVSAADMTAAQHALEQQLDASLRSAAAANLPQGFIPVDGSLSVSYSDIAQTPGAGNAVSLGQTGTGVMAIVRADDLAAALARQNVTNYNNEPVLFADPSAVTVSTETSSSTTGPLTLTVGGTPKLVWQFDQNALKQALLGIRKGDFQTIIKQYEPAIARAQASVRPFWKATFPSDPNKLTVEVKVQ